MTTAGDTPATSPSAPPQTAMATSMTPPAIASATTCKRPTWRRLPGRRCQHRLSTARAHATSVALHALWASILLGPSRPLLTPSSSPSPTVFTAGGIVRAGREVVPRRRGQWSAGGGCCWVRRSMWATIGLGSTGCHARYASRTGTGHSTSMSTRVPGDPAPARTVTAVSSTRRCNSRSKGIPNGCPKGNSTPTVRGTRRRSALSGIIVTKTVGMPARSI